MPTREEKIAFLQQQSASQGPTREQKIAFLQSKTQHAPSEPGMAQTALEGFGSGASLGYLPQLQAVTEKATDFVGNAKDTALKTLGLDDLRSIDAQLREQGFKLPEQTYTQIRDANIDRQEAQRKANPTTAGVANVAGAVTSGIASSAMAPVAAATRLGRLKQAGQIGGVMSGLANPGDIRGEFNTTGQIPERLHNAAVGTMLAAGVGGAIEAPGAIRDGVNSVKGVLAKKLGQDISATPVANKEAIEAAAKKLGIDSVPKAVTTDNPTYQKLESGLSQSGSLPAKSIREQYNGFFKSLKDASEKISALKTTDSEFASGSKIQADMGKQVADTRAPISQMYEELQPHLKKIEVNPEVTTKAFAALKRNPLFQTAQGKSLLAEYQGAVGEQPDLASLKEFRSTLSDSVSKTASPVDVKRMDAIAQTVTSIRDNTINALKQHMPKDMHAEVDQLIGDIALADSAHASSIKDINSVKTLVGNREFKSPVSFARKLGDMSESDLARKASNLDVGTFRNLKDKFPSVFEKARAAKVNDMIDSSTNAVSGFNDGRFLKQYQGLDKEMRDLLFAPEMQSHIESLQTVKQAIPEKLGPSGTPAGQMMMDMFNPKRNLLDLGIKSTLASSEKGAAPAVSPKFSTSENVLKFVAGQPKQEFGGSTAAQKVADEKPKKGPNKWANDGLQKLNDHSDDKTTLEKAKGAMRENPAVKDLLVKASDLKPGTKAMDNILAKLKSKLAKGDE